MRILMLGWEFPPFISGGLGTACYGLTKGLDRLGVEVLFVLPRPIDGSLASHVQIFAPGKTGGVAGTGRAPRPRGVSRAFRLEDDFKHVRFRTVDAALRPYQRPDDGTSAVEAPTSEVQAPSGVAEANHARPGGAASEAPIAARGTKAQLSTGPGGDYEGDLFDQIARYAELVKEICAEEDFDLIHAHDWMTFVPGIAAANLTEKPLVVQVHSTEFDRSGLHVDQRIYEIERAGMQRATRIIAVSVLTKNIILKHYGIDTRKVHVVYNAIDDNGDPAESRPLPAISRDEKIVLFLGRITMQKGPEYFLQAAKRVLEVMSNVRFIMAGSGDMIKSMIAMANTMGIGEKVLFTGFLRGDDVKRVFRMADLYVMPSVSEPFGIAPLEALLNDVPVLISKQSGVAEVLTHALKVDFWDVDEMANKIIAVLRHPPLQATLRDHGSIEVRRFSWTDSAAACVEVYQKACGVG